MRYLIGFFIGLLKLTFILMIVPLVILILPIIAILAIIDLGNGTTDSADFYNWWLDKLMWWKK